MVEVGVNKAAIGKAFKKEAGGVVTAVHALEDEEKLRMKEQLTSDTYKVDRTLRTFTNTTHVWLCNNEAGWTASV